MDLSHARIIVVGAGVLGLATAAALTRRGATVRVIDDAPEMTNASGVAAGMIAPGLEAALEDESRERADLYRAAAGLWPDFGEAHGIGHVRDGADWRGPVEPLAGRLNALGFSHEFTAVGLRLPGESRVVDPSSAIDILSRGLALGRGTVEAVEAGVVHMTSGARARADAVVLATGWQAPSLKAPGLEAMLGQVSPIKGHILLIQKELAVVRATRGEGIYLVPHERGVLAGATMEAGFSDRAVDLEIVERLRAAAIALEPSLAGARLTKAMTGIRGSTPDGLPMAGATSVPGVFAALAPRRNGWLLAPMVAGIVAAAIAEEAPPEGAEAFRPDRFGPA
jgi:glycine oxidase